jgi:hypothetical protein
MPWQGMSAFSMSFNLSLWMRGSTINYYFCFATNELNFGLLSGKIQTLQRAALRRKHIIFTAANVKQKWVFFCNNLKMLKTFCSIVKLKDLICLWSKVS